VTKPQLDQVTTIAAQVPRIAAQVPRHLRAQFLSRFAELLPQDYGDADLWRAAHKAAQEVLTAR
jgi:hypothetical protein